MAASSFSAIDCASDEPSVVFTFPDDIPIDPAHTLDQLTGMFRSVREGLPELIKNSKDQYSRLGVADRDMRQILVLANTESKTLGVLDFAGAQLEDFSGWTTWSSRTAGRSQLSEDIEAGHGNGGKAFMVHGAKTYSSMESCCGGKRTKMGFRNDLPGHRYKPGHARHNGRLQKDVPESDPRRRLEEFLSYFNLRFTDMPMKAQAAFKQRHAFTGVLLSDVTEWEGRRRHKVQRLAQGHIPQVIATNGQTAMTIETCDVWVVVDSEITTDKPIAPTSLSPYRGFEEPSEFAIPDTLVDPETGDIVDTRCEVEGPRFVRLSTSAKQLQLSDDTKARNVIRVWNSRNNAATWPLHTMGVLSPTVSFIYGELRCPALLGEHLAGAERMNLANTPLVRALREFTREKISELADALHRAMMAENKPREREHAKAALEGLRDLMRKFLDPDAVGEAEDDDNRASAGNEGKGKGRRRRRKYKERGNRIDQIVLEPGRSELAIAAGTSVPLRYKCLERQNDGTWKAVRGEDLVVSSTLPGNVQLFEGRIRSDTVGSGQIWLETRDGLVTSEPLRLEIVHANNVSIAVPDSVVRQGERIKLNITFDTPGGPRDDLALEGGIDEPGMGLLGRLGRFTAGFKQGQATVRLRFGLGPESHRAAVVQIGSERVEHPQLQGSGGADIPEILLCGEEAPGMDEYPIGQRTMPPGEQSPTIIEDPLFPNIVWINPTSKEAMRVRKSRGGPSGAAGIALCCT